MMENTHKELYREETLEHLAQMEDTLLELEESPDDMDLVGTLFRSIHTIKGSGAMFGFDDIVTFTHEIETVFDLVRQGKMAPTAELIDLSLKARDCIRMLLGGSDLKDPVIEQVHLAFQRYTQSSDQDLTYRIRFRPHGDMFQNGTSPIPLLRELHDLGECRALAQLEEIPPLHQCGPEACYTYWDIILTTDKGVNAIKDVFIFVEDLADVTIDAVDEDKKLGEILLEKGDVTAEALKTSLDRKKLIGEILVDTGAVPPEQVQSALIEQEQVRKKKGQEDAIESIRVAATKLDTLVDLVGEMVTLQARIAQRAATTEDLELILISEQVERLTSELRDNAMSMRMLPIGTTFARFKRLVRDLSRELGKEIELVTEGAQTELDKTIIERLNDPLVHILRNSIDHGIESPELREARGKSKTGTIRLSALHSGAHVIISVKDDGNGLDRAAILAKALERGIISDRNEPADKEIYSFIFHPGFSTAREVTNVSGRGVGMDVVKKTIDSLKASVEVQSEPGRGTTVTIKLPLTLAIVEGLLVTITDQYYVLPLSVVEECVELTKEDVVKSHGRNLAQIRGEIVPYIRLRNEFSIHGEAPDMEQIVVTGNDGNRVGFVVDSVIGQHQTVIKSLGKFYRHVEGISGATILGDGTVALIVDTPQLLNKVELAEAVFG